MTKPMMDLRELVEKSADADLLREMIGFAAERLMELEVGAKTGAGYHQKTPERQAQRNGYRERDWQTRAGNVELRIPKLRTGSYFPSFLEPRRAAEKALSAVIQEAYVHGVSTRSMDDLVQAMGGTGISKSQVSRLCEEIDERVDAFLTRPIDGEWPYLWIAGWPYRLRCRHHRCRRQYGRPARGAGHGHRPVRGRDLLDGVSAGSGAARAAGRETGYQRCARGHQGLGRTRAEHDLAALSGAFPEERSCACGQEQPTRRLRLYRHRLRTAGPCDGENPMAQHRRPDAGQVAEALRAVSAAHAPFPSNLVFVARFVLSLRRGSGGCDVGRICRTLRGS